MPRSFASTDPIEKAIFTRPEMTVADLAEVVYLRQEVVRPAPRPWWFRKPPIAVPESKPLLSGPRPSHVSGTTRPGDRWTQNQNSSRTDAMTTTTWLTLPEIEQRLLTVTSEQLNVPRKKLSSSSRIIEDLNCDCLDAVDLLMAVEDAFDVTIPARDDFPHAAGKVVFTRAEMTLGDFAELVYLQQGTGKPDSRPTWFRKTPIPATEPTLPFTQLSGTWQPETDRLPLFEHLPTDASLSQFRRRSDGMRCVLLSSATITMGCDGPEALPDEQPVHDVELDTFLIDLEPVSTTAYCRFLNSVDATRIRLVDWFVLDAQDHRQAQMPLTKIDEQWRPLPGTEHLPMVLVSWYGANAYALWAHGCSLETYREASEFLPTEAQWEYAARGPAETTPEEPDKKFVTTPMVHGQHEIGATYTADSMPMALVHAPYGMSPFGIHHMGGNVWQWCQDWYDESFYQRADARAKNSVNRVPTSVRSERGGSWVGPAELCRPSYRRGRVPVARGRCLGFRCVTPPHLLPPTQSPWQAFLSNMTPPR